MSVTQRFINRVGMSRPVQRTVTGSAAIAPLAERFVGGDSAHTAVAAVARLRAAGALATVHVRRGSVVDHRGATDHVAEYTKLVHLLAEHDLAIGTEISVKLEQCGLRTPGGWRSAMAHLSDIVHSAEEVGIAVCLDTEAADEVDATYEAVRHIRQTHPDVAMVMQAYLRRTESDLTEFAVPGSRIRLCKGGYSVDAGDGDRAFTSRVDIDRSYVRCLRHLMSSGARPLVATHDPQLVAVAQRLALRAARTSTDHEYQLLQGVQPILAHRLLDEGETVRLYVAYGPEWYGWLVRRLSERPRNLALLTPHRNGASQ